MKYSHVARRAGAVVLLCMIGLAIAEESVYREFFPRTAIDPAKGYLGDADWSGTLQYWITADAFERNKHFADQEESEWKLNSKQLDLERVDFHFGYVAITDGKALVDKLSRKKPGFLTCLGESKVDLRGIATTYPKFDTTLGRIMTVDARVEHCAKSVLGERIDQGTVDNVAITAYIMSLSTGMPINLNLQSEPLMQAYRRGEQLFYTKVGRNNFACASCHAASGMMGKSIRGERPTTPFGDAGHFPAFRLPRYVVESLHERLRMCNFTSGTYPLPHGDPVYVDLEVFLSVLSNKYPIAMPAAR